MKGVMRSLVVAILGRQVRKLQAKNNFKTIGVVGSYGKTSTKLAIAELLESEFHVQYQKGNYNVPVTVPLVFFGQELPSLANPFAWLMVFWRNHRQLKDIYPHDIVVVELSIDGPGQMEEFQKFLRLDLAVVTALGPEHMEFFDSVDQVAREELSVHKFSEEVLINGDLCPKRLLKSLPKPYQTYSLGFTDRLPLDNWVINMGEGKTMRITQQILSKARLYSLSTAAVVGQKFNLDEDKIHKKLKDISTVSGRMNVLKGVKKSILIDDTYNASPEATILALETLYSYPAKQRIALLGNMNELGKFSEKLHKEVGQACDPGKVDAVITLGPDANEYLAAEAEKRGCKVIRTKTPQQAADAIDELIKPDSVILAKGSQNGVFAEEAVKILLEDNSDVKQLVRQGDSWMDRKQFNYLD